MQRFEFGSNWRDYLHHVSDEEVSAAIQALASFLGKDSLRGLRFLDIGCGSGMHSLAAFRLGASGVVSLDYDPLSVDCARSLKQKEGDPASWRLFQWDILSVQPFPEPEPFDVVYAWGVLHHTGAMWRAIEQSLLRVKANGLFYVALYNTHWSSPLWKIIKRFYCASPHGLQHVWLFLYGRWELLKLKIRGAGRDERARGMKWQSDLKDWLGGYPYEHASAPEVISFMNSHGFALIKNALNNGTGCSEFLFRRQAAS